MAKKHVATQNFHWGAKNMGAGEGEKHGGFEVKKGHTVPQDHPHFAELVEAGLVAPADEAKEVVAETGKTEGEKGKGKK